MVLCTYYNIPASPDILHNLYHTVDGNPAGAKSMLNMMGFIENKLRLPLVPTRIVTYEKIREVLRQLSIKC